MRPSSLDSVAPSCHAVEKLEIPHRCDIRARTDRTLTFVPHAACVPHVSSVLTRLSRAVWCYPTTSLFASGPVAGVSLKIHPEAPTSTSSIGGTRDPRTTRGFANSKKRVERAYPYVASSFVGVPQKPRSASSVET